MIGAGCMNWMLGPSGFVEGGGLTRFVLPGIYRTLD